jgi:FkbM family methyltransferase
MSNEIIEAINNIGAHRRWALNSPPMQLGLSDFPFLNLSFSIYGEDLLLVGMLKDKIKTKTPGFYIDLGSAHPRQASNSYLFYCFGWRGICIDANPMYAAEYPQTRPNDIFVQAAVSQRPQQLYFAKHRHNLGMSKVVASPEVDGDFAPAIPVPSATLRDILQTEIDFLSLDIEDGELGALESNDWYRFSPQVILMETHGIDFERPREYPTVAYLLERGYRYLSIVGPNVLMCRANASS